jgi:hypothetical protein
MVYAMAVGDYHTVLVASEANSEDIPGIKKEEKKG